MHFFLHSCLLGSIAASPSCQKVKAGWYLGQVVGSSQGHVEINRHSHSHPRFTLVNCINWPHVHGHGLWEEAGVTRVNPHSGRKSENPKRAHTDSRRTPHTKTPDLESNPWPSCFEASALTTSPPWSPWEHFEANPKFTHFSKQENRIEISLVCTSNH